MDTAIRSIDDSLVDLENMAADQVTLDISMEVLDELNDLMIPHAKVMSPLLDISTGETDDDDIKAFLERHKPRLADMKAQIKTVENEIQKSFSNESKVSNVLIQRSGKTNLP